MDPRQMDPIKCKSCGKKVRPQVFVEGLSLWEVEEGPEALVKITGHCPECGEMALDIEGIIDSEEA